MPGTVWLTNRATGQDDPIAPEGVADALASGKYLDPSAVAVHRAGVDMYAAPDVARQEQAFTPAIDPAIAAKTAAHTERELENSGVAATAKAVLGGGASGLSFGLLNPFEEAQEFNPIASGIGQVTGALAPAFVGDVGGLLGLGRAAGVADDALTAERATSALSSRALFAGERAAGAGELERGLVRANGAIGDAHEIHAVAPDLAGLDAKGLRAARDAEIETIEAGRVPQRASLAEDLGAFRQQTQEDKLFLTTKGIKGDGINTLGKRTLKADQQIDRLLDNPIRLAQKPELALAALQQQDAALEGILAKSDKLRAAFAADETGTRAATLDKIPATLERNRALQQRIATLTAEPTSERLLAIENAQEALRIPKPAAPPASMAEQALSGTAFGAITSAAHALPIIGQIPGAAHFIGAKGAKLVTDLVFGKIGAAAAGIEARASAAAERFLDFGRRGLLTPQVPALAVRAGIKAAQGDQPPKAASATDTLASISFAASKAKPTKSPPAAETPKDLVTHYKARSEEIRSQTMYGPDGTPVLRPEVRQAIGDRLAGVRAVSPLLADRMETVAARRIEFLSSILPRLPSIGGVQIGPLRRVPSDMAIRRWSRGVAAVERPLDVLERAAHGRVSPIEAHAVRTVYPEMLKDWSDRIIPQLPELSENLPYDQRLALSILTGVPVDASMQPGVLRELQSMYTNEPGTQGGTQGPTPQPQFGSVKRSEPGTPAQRREGLTS